MSSFDLNYGDLNGSFIVPRLFAKYIHRRWVYNVYTAVMAMAAFVGLIENQLKN